MLNFFIYTLFIMCLIYYVIIYYYGTIKITVTVPSLLVLLKNNILFNLNKVLKSFYNTTTPEQKFIVGVMFGLFVSSFF